MKTFGASLPSLNNQLVLKPDVLFLATGLLITKIRSQMGDSKFNSI